MEDAIANAIAYMDMAKSKKKEIIAKINRYDKNLQRLEYDAQLIMDNLIDIYIVINESKSDEDMVSKFDTISDSLIQWYTEINIAKQMSEVARGLRR